MAKATETNPKEQGSQTASKLILLAGALCLMLFGFGLGRLSAAPSGAISQLSIDSVAVLKGTSHPQNLFLIQAAQEDNDPRELLPLPGNPGGQGPGGQGLQPGEGECPIYLYQDGQLFQFAPGQPGFPGGDGDQELFPLIPPSTPRTPQPPTFDGGDDVVQLPSTLAHFRTP